jgi:hypothetical protein
MSLKPIFGEIPLTSAGFKLTQDLQLVALKANLSHLSMKLNALIQ